MKEYKDHIAVILHDFRKTIIPKAALQTIHDAAQRAEAVAAAVVEITEVLLDDPELIAINDDAEEPAAATISDVAQYAITVIDADPEPQPTKLPATTPKRGRK